MREQQTEEYGFIEFEISDSSSTVFRQPQRADARREYVVGPRGLAPVRERQS